jgi:hypothetical protein
MVKIRLFLLFFATFFGVAMGNHAASGGHGEAIVDRKGFYHVLKTGGLSEIDQELATVTALGGNDGEAYSGTLLMRKAGLLKRPKEKLEAFKRGRIKLETAIHADPGKVEYHFLRLIIQEHAPRAVKYREELEADRALIRQHFSVLPADLQEAIRDYSQGSAILHPADL